MERYIKAQAMEERLEKCRHLMSEEDDDSWASAARRSGYDTAVDAATCYREPGGDIWHALADVPDDGPILLAITGETAPIPGYTELNIYYRADTHTVAREAFAWASMPELPDPEDIEC